jgi:hypothetical protein
MAEQWYYTSNGEQQGPVELVELQRLASSGQIQPSDLVWREGMPLWMPAGETRGVFPEVRQDHLPLPAAAAAASLPPEVIPVEPARAGPRPPPRRPPVRGMSTGAKVALIAGISVGIVLLVVVIVLIGLANRDRSDRGSYVVNLEAGQRDVRELRFVANQQRVTITVTSDFNTRMNLYVFDEFGGQVAADVVPHQDCRVSFWPPLTGRYRIEVVNLGPGFNRSVVRYN